MGRKGGLEDKFEFFCFFSQATFKILKRSARTELGYVLIAVHHLDSDRCRNRSLVLRSVCFLTQELGPQLSTIQTEKKKSARREREREIQPKHAEQRREKGGPYSFTIVYRLRGALRRTPPMRALRPLRKMAY